MQVPADVKNQAGTSSSSYEVRVKAIGDVNFDRTAAMTLEEKSFSIFVQTDKAIYKPGQTGKFRTHENGFYKRKGERARNHVCMKEKERGK